LPLALDSLKGLGEVTTTEGNTMNDETQQRMNNLESALLSTADFAFDLMKRAAHVDRKLCEAHGTQPEVELGEIVRLRQQLSKNYVLLKS